MFTRTIVLVDQGKTDQALNEMQRQYQLGAGIGDTASMSGDLTAMGDILLNAGRADEARKRYQQSLEITEKSGQSSEVKEDAKLANHFDLGRVALAKNDLATAKAEAEAYLKGSQEKENPGRIKQAHELAGRIALKEKKFDDAIDHLGQANQQDPYVLYETGLAYQGKGDQSKAAEMFKQAAEFNNLPTLNSAFVRAKAKRQATAQPTS
jgi:tetratricopeptide (TPR) repeat protein